MPFGRWGPVGERCLPGLNEIAMGVLGELGGAPEWRLNGQPFMQGAVQVERAYFQGLRVMKRRYVGDGGQKLDA